MANENMSNFVFQVKIWFQNHRYKCKRQAKEKAMAEQNAQNQVRKMRHFMIFAVRVVSSSEGTKKMFDTHAHHPEYITRTLRMRGHGEIGGSLVLFPLGNLILIHIFLL